MNPTPSRADDLQELRNRTNKVFEESNSEDAPAARSWMPAVDIAESQTEIVLEAELPGMQKDEIDIQLTGETLTLSGERKFEGRERGEQFHRVERLYGPWQRTFQIGVPIETGRVSASYDQGVLTVRLPKPEKIRPRQIAIDVR